MITIDSNITSQIQKWVDQEKLFEKTVDNFWNCFTNCKKDDPEEFRRDFGDGDESLISLVDPSMALVIYPDHYGNKDFTYCSIRYIVEYKGQCKGSYRAMYDLDGECFDDEWST